MLNIDPKIMSVAQFADIVLRPNPGTDGALAHYFGNYLIEKEAFFQSNILRKNSMLRCCGMNFKVWI